MALTTFGSYVTTAAEFIAHGTDVNADRTANSLPELTLAGGYTLGDLTADRDALDAKITALVGLENSIEEAIDDRDAQKANIRERLRQFRLAVRLNFKGTTYLKRVPTLPRPKTTESKFLRPFDDMADMWARINADTSVAGFTPPLLLTGAYALAGFTADLAALRASYKAVIDAENDEDIARKERDTMLDPLKERLLQYRAAIELEYGPEHAFFASLPEVNASPGGSSGGTPGGGPDPVATNGVWDSAANEAVIDWSASADPELDHYEVRVTPGSTFDPNNYTLAGSVTTLELRTTEGLANPGDTAAFSVYVVLTNGNETPSTTLVITRP